MTVGTATASNTPLPFSSTSVADPYTGATSAATSSGALFQSLPRAFIREGAL